MVCSVCGKSSSTPCAGCSKVLYCSKDCQRKDWKTHKSSCKTYRITSSPEEHGNHLVASRDIKGGETILCTSPDVIGPRMFDPQPCCLGCHSGKTKLIACQRCQLPVCSIKCMSSLFHQMECSIVSKYKENLADGIKGHSIGLSCILPLRIIALQYIKPELFGHILSMESNLEEIRKSKNWHHYQTIIDLILGLTIPEVSLEALQSIIGIVLTNTFEVFSQQNLIVGLYREASYMNHCCVGNTRLSMDGVGAMSVVASVNIKKSTPIKFNYVKSLDTTWARHEQLLENKFFACTCVRCTDPTELQTFVSALRCDSVECTGTVLPLKPLCSEENWSCTVCKQTTSPIKIRSIVESGEAELEGLDRNNLAAVKKALDKYALRFHRNHGILLQLKQTIISGYGRLPGFQVEDMSEPDHKLKMHLCLEMLAVLNILEPGLTLGRGLILFDLHSSYVLMANMEFEKKRNSNQLLVRLLEAEQCLIEADSILGLEPPSSPYGHLSQTIQRNRFELSEYIEHIKMIDIAWTF